MSFSRVQIVFTGAGDIAFATRAREIHVVERERQAPAEAAAEHEVGEAHVRDVEAERLGGGRARVQRILHAGPHLGAIAFDLRRAHHRLHRRVGEKRRAVVGGDDLRRVRRHFRRRAERLVERGEDRRGRHVAVPGVAELRLQRGERPARAPEAVGDDGDGFLELHDLLHARHRFGRRRCPPTTSLPP